MPGRSAYLAMKPQRVPCTAQSACCSTGLTANWRASRTSRQGRCVAKPPRVVGSLLRLLAQRSIHGQSESEQHAHQDSGLPGRRVQGHRRVEAVVQIFDRLALRANKEDGEQAVIE